MKRTLILTTALAAATAANAANTGAVFVIAMENHNWTQPSTYVALQQVYGNPAAPYINSLVTPGNPNAAQVSYASAYYNVPVQDAGSASGAGPVHPSEPNYIWAEAGVAGPRNDANPYPSNIVNSPNLSGVMQAAGQSWQVYAEGADLQSTNGATYIGSSTGGTLTNTVADPSNYVVPLNSFSGTSATYTNPYNGSHQYDYASKHVGQVFFTDTNGGNNVTSTNPEAAHYSPLEALASDLSNNTVAQYNWITPDQFNDMHSGLAGGFTYQGVHYTGDAAKIAQGDNFLSMIVPLIMASDAYKNNGKIIIWNDETEGEGVANFTQFTSMEIVISPLAKGNAYTNTIAYDHSSDLRTMQELFGLTPQNGYAWLGGAATATDLRDLFVAGAVPEPASWTMMVLGFGVIGAQMRRRSAKSVTVTV